MTQDQDITICGSPANESQKKYNDNLAFDHSPEGKPLTDVSTKQINLSQLSLTENDKKTEEKDANIAANLNVSVTEGQDKKIPYPKAIFTIVVNTFCLSFGFFATQSLIVLYLSRELGFDNDDATVIFHVFLMSAFFLCIIGAIVSDSWLGRFKTIFYFLIVYIIGSTMIAVEAIPQLNLPTITFTLIGLMLCGLGVGGVQPCMSAFGCDQFKLPEQENKISTFFSIYYFTINAGALIGYSITPMFRDDVQCFGEKECYFLAFLVPTLVMVTSAVIFISATRLYKITPPSGNMVVLVSKTIGNAIATKWRESKINPHSHWLDYADQKYERSLIEDTKVMMRVLVLFLPLPFFWALFYQQGSRWTLQATRMNGDMGSWDIKPEQMQVLNPLLVLVFIPIFEFAFYPLLNLIGFRRPLQKLSLGGIFASMAFIISALVELKMEQTYPTLPTAGIAQLRVYNAELCDYSVSTNLTGLNFDINSLDTYINKGIIIDATNGIKIQFQFNGKSGDSCATLPSHSCLLQSEKSYYVFLNSKNTTHPVICAEDIIAKPVRGFPLGRTLANVLPNRAIQWKNSKGALEHTEPAYLRNLTELKADTYQLLIDSIEIETVKLEVGGIYTVLIVEESVGKYNSKLVIVTEPNSVSILWQIPQYAVITIGEVMFSVTGFEFSYAQAPESMKSVLQALWLLTIAFGNLIVIVVAELSLFDSQALEFFLFAALMFADMFLFMFIAYRYIPNDPVANIMVKDLTPIKHNNEEGIDYMD